MSVKGLERDLGFFKECAVFFRLLRIFLLERPDVIHLNSSKAGGLGGVAALFLNLLSKLRSPSASRTRSKLLVIFTVHGWPFREDRPFAQKAGIFLASWASSLFHDKVILVNTADLRAAKKFIPERKRALIFNGIEAPQFVSRSAARAFFARHLGRPLTEDTLLVGTIAEYTRNKGLRYLVDAADHLRKHAPQFTFHVLLMGEGENREALARHIRVLGLDACVFLTGHITQDVSQTHTYLKGLDLFVLPSVKEGLPYAVMEAMAGGLPVAATDVGGISDLISHEGEGVLLPAKEPLALADAICGFFLSKEKRERMGGAAQKKQEKKFSLDAMVQKTMRVYDQTS